MKRLFSDVLIIIVTILLIGYFSMSKFVKHNKKSFQIPVLMYHNVLPDEYYNNQAVL